MKNKTITKALSVFLSMLMITSCFGAGLTAVAEDITTISSGTCGNDLSYVLTSDGTLTISGSGEMDYYQECFDLALIKKVVFQGSITTLCNSAFSESQIEEIVIPETVLDIGECCFSECTKLKDVTLPQGLEYLRCDVFDGCTSLTKIEIPEGVTTIDDYCFYDSGLQEVELPDSIEYIGESAFSWCQDLQNLNISSNVTYLGSAFANGVTTTIDEENERYYVDSGCIIDRNVFDVSEDEEKTVGVIGAFGNFELPKNVSCIADYALSDLYNTESVIIPACYSYLGDGIFCSWSNDNDEENYPLSVKTITFESGSTLSTLPGWFCDGCFNLESIELPDTIEAIGESAFSCCVNLQNIEIPESVNTVYPYAFCNCLSLKEVRFPKNVSYLGEQVLCMQPDCFGFDSSLLEKVIIINNDCEIKYQVFPENVTLLGFADSTAEVFSNENGIYFEEYDCPHINTKETEEVTASSCQEEGFSAGVFCVDCETYISGHESTGFGDHTNIAEYEPIKSSCSVEGFSAGVFCNDCKTWIVNRESLGFLEHVDSDGDAICDVCSTDLAIRGTIITSTTNISWFIINNVLSFEGYGYIPADCWEYVYNVDETILDSVTKIAFGEGIEYIGSDAFYSACPSLQEVVFSNSVSGIGAYAFCANRYLTSVSLGSGLKEIGDCAFSNCYSLESISFNDGLEKIKSEAFTNTKIEQNLVFPSSLKSIADDAFDLDTIQTITGYENSAAQLFAYENNIEFISIDDPNPESSGVVGNVKWEFAGNTLTFSYEDNNASLWVEFDSILDVPWKSFLKKVKHVVIEEGVANIGAYALYNATNLESVDFGSIEKIDSYAFYGCSALKEVNIPESVRDVCEYAFLCKNCQNFYWYNTDPNISIWSNAISTNGCFYCKRSGIVYYGTRNNEINCSKVVIVPDVDSGVYRNNISWSVVNNVLYLSGTGDITGIVDAKGNISYESYPWYEWSSFITGVIISGEITSVPAGSFYYCPELKYVNIDVDSDITICEKTFVDCPSLNSINIKTSKNAYIKNDAFVNVYFQDFVVKASYLDFDCASLDTENVTIDCEKANICEKGFCSVSKSVNMENTEAVLPAGCFYNNADINSIKWQNVSSFPSFCFYNCSNLTDVEISLAQEIFISENAFSSCDQIPSDFLEECIEKAFYIGDYAFEGCIINEANISKYCSYIGIAALATANLINITFPDDLISIDIEEGAFDSYSQTTIVLPVQVKSFGRQVFSVNSPVTDIYVYNRDCDIAGPVKYSIETDTVQKAYSLTIHGYRGSNAEVAAVRYDCLFVDLDGQTIDSDSISWTFDVNEKTITLSGSGDMKDYSKVEETPWFDILDDISVIKIDDGITSLGSHAFEGSSASVLILPESVSDIGSSAFANCTNLQNMNIENVKYFGIACFENCKGLNSLVVGSNVNTVCESSFAGWENLCYLRIEEGITRIPSKAFFGLNSSTVTTAVPISEIASDAFSNDLVTVVPDNAVASGSYKNYDKNTIYWFVCDDILYFCGTGVLADKYSVQNSSSSYRESFSEFFENNFKASDAGPNGLNSDLSLREYAEFRYMAYLSQCSKITETDFCNDGDSAFNYSRVWFGKGITQTATRSTHSGFSCTSFYVSNTVELFCGGHYISDIEFEDNSSLKYFGAFATCGSADSYITFPEGVLGFGMTGSSTGQLCIIPSTYRYVGESLGSGGVPVEYHSKIIYIDDYTRTISKVSEDTTVVIISKDTDNIPENAEKYYGYVGSTTEDFCEDNNKTFVPLDGEVVLYEGESSDKYADLVVSDNSISTSNNSEIATMTQDGIINGINDGQTIITVDYLLEDSIIVLSEIDVTVLPKFTVNYITDGNGIITTKDTITDIVGGTEYNIDWRPEYQANEGYLFDGYDHEPSIIEKDETIKLLFTPDSNDNNIPDKDEAHYTVTYVTDGHGTITGNDKVQNILTGTKYNTDWRPEYSANKGWYFTEYSGEVDTITGNITVTLNFSTNEVAKKLTFFAPDRVAYNIEGRGLIIDNETLSFEEGTVVRFKPRVNYDGNDYIVYLNEKPISADSDGWYTIPADTSIGLISLTPATVDEDTGEKVSFWEVLAQFVQKIINFFKGIFK